MCFVAEFSAEVGGWASVCDQFYTAVGGYRSGTARACYGTSRQRPQDLRSFSASLLPSGLFGYFSSYSGGHQSQAYLTGRGPTAHKPGQGLEALLRHMPISNLELTKHWQHHP